MSNEGGLDARMLTSDPLHGPEEERFRQLARSVVHARGDVENEYDGGLCQWLRSARELPEAQVIVGEGYGVGLDCPALDRLLDGPTAIEARARAAAVDAFAYVVGLLQAVGGLRLQVR